MALGAVQSGYAGETYAYRRRNSAREEFYGDISSAVQMMEDESENDSKVIGLAMIPYGDSNVSYGMKARYAAESTPEDPVIQVAVGCGGEQVSYKVNVNEVDPRNASQLEIFALLSYSDDQGISDGGTFGSYHRMKIYADNAQMNGYWEGNENWDDFVNAKHDWIDIITRITDDYSQAGVYSQSLNGQKLNETLSHFSIQHVDFDNLKIVDKTADAFSHYELNIPGNVLKAWLEAVGEMGGDRIDNDMYSHMTFALIRRFSQVREEDPAGDPIEAALRAAREAMQELGYQLAPELEGLSEVQRELENERAFYQSFVQKLEKLRENGTEENVKNIKTAGKSDDAEEAEDIDLMQLLRERMEEIFVMVKNGDTEPSFQIGNSSFTVKEWERFLERFDDIEDAIRELMRERIEKRTIEEGEAAEREAASIEAAGEAADGSMTFSKAIEEINMLISESTKCTYPASTPGQEDIMYITWYTEEGIFCRKAGQREGYEWSVYFEGKEDYSRVMEFLGRFDREDNLRFAAHENFWQDFLKGEIDLDGFMEFYAGTDHGVPDYTVSRDGSIYIDREKIQWAKYMNSLGNRLYTREEMMQMQEKLIEANKAKLTKRNLSDWQYLTKWNERR